MWTLLAGEALPKASDGAWTTGWLATSHSPARCAAAFVMGQKVEGEGSSQHKLTLRFVDGAPGGLSRLSVGLDLCSAHDLTVCESASGSALKAWSLLGVSPPPPRPINK